MNPFDWSGPFFLQLYVGLGILALGLALWWRHSLNHLRSAETTLPELHAYEIAHLIGGPPRAVDTALAHLVESGVLKFDESNRTFHKIGDLPRDAHPLEKVLVGAIRTSADVAALRTAAASEIGRIRERLERLGLELNDSQVSTARWYPLLPLVAVLVFGLIKLGIGLERDRPVGFLILGSVILAVVCLVLINSVSRLSRRGRQQIDEIRARHAALEVAASKAPATLVGPDLTLAVCLFGPMVLAGGPLMPMQQIMHGNVLPGGGGAYGNACGSSCGSSGSSCGGSSCGGGGCGGCGGGD